MSSELTRLYRDAILKHAAQPVGFRQAISITHRNEQYNPLCGDRIEIMLHVNEAEIVAAAFDGEACKICTASASMLCELAPGRSLREMDDAHQWLGRALSNAGETTDFCELQPLLGVRRFPSRIRCVLLPWEALDLAVNPVSATPVCNGDGAG